MAAISFPLLHSENKRLEAGKVECRIKKSTPMKRMYLLAAALLLFAITSCDDESSTKGDAIFWTQEPTLGGIDVWVDDVYRGSITTYFATYDPNCGESGTLTVPLDPGSYDYRAVRASSVEWNGTITVNGNSCTTTLLE